MRITVFGASGATGRLLTAQALAAGYEVTAVTRQPAAIPIRHERLTVAGADVRDAEAVSRVIAGAGAVLSVLGVPLTCRPVDVYSAGTGHVTAAMSRHGVRRLAVVSSSATYPHHHADGGFLLNHMLQPLLTATISKTTHRDMRIMEELLRGSELDWTVMRPFFLFDAPAVTRYELHEDQAPGIFTSRCDLAASLLEQVTSTRFIRKAAAVTTSEGAPTLLQILRREAFTSR